MKINKEKKHCWMFVSLQHIYLIAKTWTAKKHDPWTMRLNLLNLHIQCTFDYSLFVANLCLWWLFSLRKVQVAPTIYCDWLCNCCGYYVHVYPQSPWVQSFTTYPFRLSMVSQWSVYWNPILTLTLTNRFVVHLTPVLPSSSYRRPKDINHKNTNI